MNCTIISKLVFIFLLVVSISVINISSKACILSMKFQAVDSSTVIDFSKGKWVELTHTFCEDIPIWPGDEALNEVPFHHINILEGMIPNDTYPDFYMAMGKISVLEHSGTHIDAPSHFKKGAASTGDIPLEKLLGLAVIINVEEKVKDYNYLIHIEDVQEWEEKNKISIEDKILIFNTGKYRFWRENKVYSKKYYGIEKDKTGSIPKFSSLSCQLAEWLVKERKIKSVGIDVGSVDSPHLSPTYPVHKTFAEGGIPAFENVANLDQLENAPTAFVAALPIKTKNGNGGPFRIVAFVKVSNTP